MTLTSCARTSSRIEDGVKECMAEDHNIPRVRSQSDTWQQRLVHTKGLWLCSAIVFLRAHLLVDWRPVAARDHAEAAAGER